MGACQGQHNCTRAARLVVHTILGKSPALLGYCCSAPPCLALLLPYSLLPCSAQSDEAGVDAELEEEEEDDYDLPITGTAVLDRW